MDVSTFRNGDTIPEAKTPEDWIKAGENGLPAWCYYDNNPEKNDPFGKLYNWFAVNDARGLAPQGWHIPGNDEWTVLTDFLGGDTVAGTKMKYNEYWNDEDQPVSPGTNESGFSAVPGGIRYRDGRFLFNGEGGGYWSSTESTANNAWFRKLYYKEGVVLKYDLYKHSGLSVRCLQD